VQVRKYLKFCPVFLKVDLFHKSVFFVDLSFNSLPTGQAGSPTGEEKVIYARGIVCK
jgi:hypothetical protein